MACQSDGDRDQSAPAPLLDLQEGLTVGGEGAHVLTGNAFQSKSPQSHLVNCGPHPFVRDVLGLFTPPCRVVEVARVVEVEKDKQCRLLGRAAVDRGPLLHSCVECKDTRRPLGGYRALGMGLLVDRRVVLVINFEEPLQ